MAETLKNIAVLIDADNASAKNIEVILQKIQTLGSIGCKKIYGDWGNEHIKGWQQALLKHAIEPMQQFAYVKGKNATDIGMVIEAMDLLYSKQYDGFCLISSDSDFTSLALRLREDKIADKNIQVFGFGKKNTVAQFQQACNEFFYVENLSASSKSVTKNIPPIAPAKPLADKPQTKSTPQNTITQWDGKRLKCDTKLLNALRAAIINNPQADKEGWINLATIGEKIRKFYPKFSAKKYGYQTTSKLIKQIEFFETKTVNSTTYVRIRPKPIKPACKEVKPPHTTQIETPNFDAHKWTAQKLRTQTPLVKYINALIDSNLYSIDGWADISYVARELRKKPDINLDKYGYKKFSDLITALRLYEIKRQNNQILIKAKKPVQTDCSKKIQTINKQKPQPTAASHVKCDKVLTKALDTPLRRYFNVYCDPQISLYIIFSSKLALSASCINTVIGIDNKANNNAAILTRQVKNEVAKYNGRILFDKLPPEIKHISVIAVSKVNGLTYKNTSTIETMVKNEINKVLNSNTTNIIDNKNKGLLLFSLSREEKDWSLLPKYHSIDNEISYLLLQH